jgi:hypothetical protein
MSTFGHRQRHYWLYTHGYHGSKRFTYADALAWAQTTEEAALFVCK